MTDLEPTTSSRRPCCASSSPSSGDRAAPDRHGPARRPGDDTGAEDDPAARDARPADRADPPALPGGGQPGPRPCATAASTGRTSSAGRGLGDDARPGAGSARSDATEDARRARRLPAAPAADPRRGRSSTGPTPRAAARGAHPPVLQDPRPGPRDHRRRADVVRRPTCVHDVAVHVLAAVRRRRTRPWRDRRGPPATSPPDTAVVDLYLPLRPGRPTVEVALGAELAAARRRRAARSRCGASRSSLAPAPRHDVLTFRRPDDDGVRPYWMAPEALRSAGDRGASRRTSSSAACTR